VSLLPSSSYCSLHISVRLHGATPRMTAVIRVTDVRTSDIALRNFVPNLFLRNMRVKRLTVAFRRSVARFP
jgi:hypothetical protein